MASIGKGNLYGKTYTEAAVTAILGGTFVKLVTDGAGGVQLATCGLHQGAVGAALFDAGDQTTTPPQTKQATFQRGGIRKMIAGAAITPGDGVYVMSDASGRPIPYVAGSGVFANGIPRTSAAGLGSEVEVYLLEAPAQPS